MASTAAHMVNPEAVTCLFSHPCPQTQKGTIKFRRGLGYRSLGPRSNLLFVCCSLTSTGLLCFPSSSMALKKMSTSHTSTFCPYPPHTHEYEWGPWCLMLLLQTGDCRRSDFPHFPVLSLLSLFTGTFLCSVDVFLVGAVESCYHTWWDQRPGMPRDSLDSLNIPRAESPMSDCLQFGAEMPAFRAQCVAALLAEEVRVFSPPRAFSTARLSLVLPDSWGLLLYLLFCFWNAYSTCYYAINKCIIIKISITR